MLSIVWGNLFRYSVDEWRCLILLSLNIIINIAQNKLNFILIEPRHCYFIVVLFLIKIQFPIVHRLNLKLLLILLISSLSSSTSFSKSVIINMSVENIFPISLVIQALFFFLNTYHLNLVKILCSCWELLAN